ncbi:MAG: glutamine--fructose-6-phosphate transaminase (isomerizing), partial [Cellulosilyticaceae bacterium]
MCGIVGYFGGKNAKDVIVRGLSNLEYRGYDSSGIALINQEGKLEMAKKKGRLQELETFLTQHPMEGGVGIGHTRWATHGAPSDTNSHPHLNGDKTFAVVHNGIIENYMELKEELMAKGYVFQSETDTEVIVHLIDSHYKGDFKEAVDKTLSQLKGAYAIGVVSSYHPEELIAARKESPLIVGCEEDGYYIASDVPAILEYTRKVYYIDNDEVVHMKKDGMTIYNKEGMPVEKDITLIDWDVEAASKNGFDHFMLKEIYDQPTAIRETLLRRLDNNKVIQLDDITLEKEDLDNINRIYIVACGTAYHAGVVGKYAIEKLAHIPVQTDIASEFRYSDPFVDEHTLLIVVSQSGETADTLAAIKEAKRKGARVLAITNVVGSSVAREAEDVFYTWAGPEISVASTKAYTAQLVAFYMIALHFARIRETITYTRYTEIIDQIENLAIGVEEILENKESIAEIAATLKDA